MNPLKTVPFVLALVFGLSVSTARADEHEGKQKNHHCKNIVAACEAGGYVKGGHKKDNKGLWKDCVQVIKSGKSVPGVTVSESDVQECKAKKERRHERKAKKAAEESSTPAASPVPATPQS